MKRLVAVIVLLLVLTPGLWLGAILFHPKAEVGIILVDDCEEHLGEVAAEAFKHYGEYFSARVLPVRFNTTGVRIKDGDYLNSDIFRLGNSEKFREKYNVDMILFVTDHRIKDWDQDGGGIWGQAHPPTGAALMTVAPWQGNLTKNGIVIKHVALHEVFHLLGYPHNTWDRSGIMQYASNTHHLNLCPYYEAQLPLRMFTYKLGLGLPFKYATLINNLGFALVLLPAFMAVELAIHRSYGSFKGKRTTSKVLVPIVAFQIIVLHITLMGSFVTIWFPIIFMLFYHHIYYVYYHFKEKKDVFHETVDSD